MNFYQTIILAIIEGLTEFLPISSTGHMILASSAMKIHEDPFVQTFEVVIQIGAILAIAAMYYKSFIQGLTIYGKLLVAFLPTAVVGFLAYDTIKLYLFSPLVVAVALIIGGFVLIWIDTRVMSKKSIYLQPGDISYKHAFFIGIFQCLSMVPGTSRAAATIIGGVFNGLDKKQATEFSFLLAVPTMFAASGYDLFKSPIAFSSHELVLLGIGMIGAFISAWFAVKIFFKDS